MAAVINDVLHGDCLEGMDGLDDGSVDLRDLILKGGKIDIQDLF